MLLYIGPLVERWSIGHTTVRPVFDGPVCTRKRQQNHRNQEIQEKCTLIIKMFTSHISDRLSLHTNILVFLCTPFYDMLRSYVSVCVCVRGVRGVRGVHVISTVCGCIATPAPSQSRFSQADLFSCVSVWVLSA